jgi:chromate transporter
MPPNGLAGAALALAAIYLPSFLLVLGVLPFWTHLRSNAVLRAGLDAANAAVVGLLLAALYDPIFVSAVTRPADLAVALLALAALAMMKLPPWLVVVLCGVAGLLLG